MSDLSRFLKTVRTGWEDDTGETTMNEATPRPWGVSGTMVSSPDRETVMLAIREGRTITSRRVCICEPSPYASEATCEANAALIVRAVNAHDDLVAACEPIMREAQEQTDFADPSWNESAHIELTLTIAEIRAIVAALAKART